MKEERKIIQEVKESNLSEESKQIIVEYIENDKLSKFQNILSFYGTLIFSFSITSYFWLINKNSSVIESLLDWILLWIFTSVLLIKFFEFRNKKVQ